MSTKAHKRARQLQAYARRRAGRPEATVTQHASLRITHAVEQRMLRDHADVLQNVEFSLVNAAKDSGEIDDHCVKRILLNAIQGKSSEDPIVEWALNLLAAVRDQRRDVSDDLWRDALRVIYASLHRHSSCEPGDTFYLRFVSRYVG